MPQAEFLHQETGALAQDPNVQPIHVLHQFLHIDQVPVSGPGAENIDKAAGPLRLQEAVQESPLGSCNANRIAVVFECGRPENAPGDEPMSVNLSLENRIGDSSAN